MTGRVRNTPEMPHRRHLSSPRTFWLALLGLALALVAPGGARADSLAEVFSRGNAAFSRGEPEAALRDYLALVEAGVDDPDLAFNLASTYGALGRYGQAIRYFERALRLSPRDAGAREGLRLARDALGERQARASGEAIVVERPPLTEAIFSFASANALATALLVSAWLAAGLWLLLPRVRVEGLRLACEIAASLLTGLALLSALGVGAKADWGRAGHRGVVVREAAPLREGPDDLARLRTELAEGESVRVLAREGRFARIVARGGQIGYVRSEDVGEI